MEPVPQQEGHPADQEGHAAHHGVSEGRPERHHQEPDAQLGHATQGTLVFLGEEEVDEHREDADDPDQIENDIPWAAADRRRHGRMDLGDEVALAEARDVDGGVHADDETQRPP